MCGSRGPSHRPRLSPHLEERSSTGQFSRSSTTTTTTKRQTDRRRDRKRVPVHSQSLPIHVLLLHKLQSQRAVLLKCSTNKNTEGTQPITAGLGGSRSTSFDRKHSRQRATPPPMAIIQKYTKRVNTHLHKLQQAWCRGSITVKAGKEGDSLRCLVYSTYTSI